MKNPRERDRKREKFQPDIVNIEKKTAERKNKDNGLCDIFME